MYIGRSSNGGGGDDGNDLANYEKNLEEAVEVHQNALDDLVKVNSLFTAAVFVGLAFASAGQQNIEGNKLCEAGVYVARRLVRNEVISFACYLLSSLVAKALKTHLFTYLKIDKKDDWDKKESIKRWPKKALRGTLFTLSAFTSIIGGVFLMYSMVDMIQLRLGKIACKGTETIHAVGTLIAVNSLALVMYVPFVLLAIFNSTKLFDNLNDHDLNDHDLSYDHDLSDDHDLNKENTDAPQPRAGATPYA